MDNYVRQIIRPPKRQYKMHDLGQKVRFSNGKPIIRIDFQFISRSLTLQGSYFIQDMPSHRCVIYLHGNASCRVEGVQYLEFLAKMGMNLCVFDFGGCGMSEGANISMGYYEQEDVQALMRYIESNFGVVDQFVLWGRSMGAVTALLLFQHPRVHQIISDSAFSSFEALIRELGARQFGYLSFLLCIGIPLLRSKILDQGNFDIYLLNPLEKVQNQSNKPVYFIAGKSDQLIVSSHTETLYQSCGSTKKYIDICEGDHNSTRPVGTMFQIRDFLQDFQQIQNIQYQEKIRPHFQTQLQIQQQQIAEYHAQQNKLYHLQQLKKLNYNSKSNISPTNSDIEIRNTLVHFQNAGDRDIQDIESYI